MDVTYSNHGEYLIPDIEMDKQPDGTLGKYGRMRKRFLQENRKGTYNTLLMNGTLTAHLLEIDQTAREQIEQAVSQMAKKARLSESLKASDPMAWTGQMNALRSQAEELTIAELLTH